MKRTARASSRSLGPQSITYLRRCSSDQIGNRTYSGQEWLRLWPSQPNNGLSAISEYSSKQTVSVAAGSPNHRNDLLSHHWLLTVVDRLMFDSASSQTVSRIYQARFWQPSPFFVRITLCLQALSVPRLRTKLLLLRAVIARSGTNWAIIGRP